jgi:hypothetical protein
LELAGFDDVDVTNFNWQASYLGSFYQPNVSLTIDAGDPTADQLGLYQFTTQTAQTKEQASIADIGYHYVAIDPSTRLPYSTYTYGVADYLSDSDGNGLPDSWETSYFGHLGVSLSGDPDGDGLNNLQEYLHGSNPKNPDTDSDTMPDGLEVELGNDPLSQHSNAIWFLPQ